MKKYTKEFFRAAMLVPIFFVIALVGGTGVVRAAEADQSDGIDDELIKALSKDENDEFQKILMRIVKQSMEEQKKIRREKLWPEFRTEMKSRFDAVVKEYRSKGLPAEVEIKLVADNEEVAIETVVPRKDGTLRIEVYRISRSGLYDINIGMELPYYPLPDDKTNFRIELEIARKYLKAFCRKAMEWKEQGLIVSSGGNESAQFIKKPGLAD